MNLKVGQYVYGYVPFSTDVYGVYEITNVDDNSVSVTAIAWTLGDQFTKHNWGMPKVAITIVFDTTDLNLIKQQYPELFV